MSFFSETNSHHKFIRAVLLILVFLFLFLIQDYIIPLLLAVVFAGLMHPVYLWFIQKFKGKRKSLSAIFTIVLFLIIIVVPSFFLIEQILNQAIMVSEIALPFIEKNILHPADGSNVNKLPEWMPFKTTLEPYSEEILTKVTEAVGRVSGYVVNGLSSLTQGTFIFFLNMFVMLYALYYFLINGNTILKLIPDFLPFTKKEFKMLKKQVTSVAKATLKGAFLIGIIQGFLIGVAFAVAGLPGAIFWGSVAALLSLIPSVGSSLIYVPAGLYLIAIGEVGTGVGILIWGFGVVSSVDNFLRPYLVGKDIQMPDILILTSTLGGITFFGISGIILGPLIAGLLLTMAKIYKNSKPV